MLPEEVVTTCPFLAPFFTGDVVMFVPSLKPLAFFTRPVMLPSLFCLKFVIVGMLDAAALGFDPPPNENIPPPLDFFAMTFVPDDLAGALGAAGFFLALKSETVGDLVFWLMEMVPWALGAGFGATFFGDEPPNRLKVPLGLDFLGAGVVSTGAAGLSAFFGDDPPNRLKVPLDVAFLGAGAFFSTTGALGAGFLLAPPNRLNVPLGVAFLGAGAFASTTAFALGLLQI